MDRRTGKRHQMVSRNRAPGSFSFSPSEGDWAVCRGPSQLNIYGAALGRGRMNRDLDLLRHDFLIADEPLVLHAQDCHVRFDFLRNPPHELCPDSAHAPIVILLTGNSDVRPSPIKTAMINVILREIVGQNLSIETVNWMKIAGAALSCRCARSAYRRVIVHKDRPFPFPKAERFVVDRFESKKRLGRRR